MKKSLSLALCAVFTLSSWLTSCSKSEKPLTAAEHLDLGEKYMMELNYEQAIPHFLELIEIDPKYEQAEEQADEQMKAQAYISLVNAYEQSGRPKKGQAVLEVGFAVLHENEVILENLLNTMIENGDAQAVSALMTDIQRTGNLNKFGFADKQQRLIYSGESDFIESLISALYEQEDDSLLALCLELMLLSNMKYESDYDRSETIIRFLIERGEAIPRLNAFDEFYFGEYDDEGNRHGFGICIYGEGVDVNSTIYIGYWDNDLRNGEGVIYYGAYNYIKGNWTDDLPNGIMVLRYTGEIITEVRYEGGVLQASTIDYYDDGRMPANSLWDGGGYLRG